MTGATTLAIETFRTLKRAERRVEKLNTELRSYVRQIPDEEMPEYIAITTEMEREK